MAADEQRAGPLLIAVESTIPPTDHLTTSRLHGALEQLNERLWFSLRTHLLQRGLLERGPKPPGPATHLQKLSILRLHLEERPKPLVLLLLELQKSLMLCMVEVGKGLDQFIQRRRLHDSILPQIVPGFGTTVTNFVFLV